MIFMMYSYSVCFPRLLSLAARSYRSSIVFWIICGRHETLRSEKLEDVEPIKRRAHVYPIWVGVVLNDCTLQVCTAEGWIGRSECSREHLPCQTNHRMEEGRLTLMVSSIPDTATIGKVGCCSMTTCQLDHVTRGIAYR